MSRTFQAKSFVLIFLSCCALMPALMAQDPALADATSHYPTRLITQPIDSNRLHTIAGNTRPEANAQNDRGGVPDTFAMDHMQLQLQRSPEREQALRAFIDQQHDSTSPNFHHWLTAT